METVNQMSDLELVRHFCEQWPWLTRGDFHEILADDCVYLNMPMPHLRCVGPDQAYDLISAFSAPWTIEMKVLHICGGDNVVLTERVERFESKTGNGVVVNLHTMGAFELKNGKIIHWRDYFDSRESQPLTG